MNKKKPNPRRVPRTQADVERATKKAFDDAAANAMVLFLTVMLDKEGADEEMLCRIMREVEDLSTSVVEGYVSVSDLKHVLKTEYNIYVD